MPAHKGVEPFTRVWVVQVYQKQQVSTFKDSVTGQTMAWYLKVKVLPSESAYQSYKAGLASSRDTGIAADYGEQRWRNKKSFFIPQFDDVFAYGNWIPNWNG
jgi:hypothetical protein